MANYTPEFRKFLRDLDKGIGARVRDILRHEIRISLPREGSVRLHASTGYPIPDGCVEIYVGLADRRQRSRTDSSESSSSDSSSLQFIYEPYTRIFGLDWSFSENVRPRGEGLLGVVETLAKDRGIEEVVTVPLAAEQVLLARSAGYLEKHFHVYAKTLKRES